MPKKNKGKEIFEAATVQCGHCGRFFVRQLAHICNTGYRKHHHIWLPVAKIENKLT